MNIIIMIDELENLLNEDRKHFEVIIDFLNINAKGFVKIGISNTLDLFSDVSKKKVFLFFKFLIFKPYKENEIVNLIKHKLKEILGDEDIPIQELFSEKNFNYIAKKTISNKSGDMRFVLRVISSIFEYKLQQIKRKGKNNRFSLEDIQISISDVIEVINSKLDGKEKEIILSMNFPT